MQLQDIPRQLWLTLAVEGGLVMMTLILLSEPGFMIRPRGPLLRKMFLGSGLAFLCITFFWSFILGHLIAIFHLTHGMMLGE